jgi:hydroxymethylpyrimidine kinase/phosphomethylpyrimidine kinase
VLNNAKQPVVLTIAGFDPSGGAGILADIKTIAAFGCYGLAVVSSITAQNTQGVFGAFNQTGETTRRQLAPLFDDFEISAIKTGMLPTAEVISEVARTLKSNPVPVLIVDPVLTSTSGYDLVDDLAVETLIRELFPLASLVTPNSAEATRLTGSQVDDPSQVEDAADIILRMGAGAVLITGGDADTGAATDLLRDREGILSFSAERIVSNHTHGTGCTLSSALACLLAQGRSIREAVPIAKDYVSRAILSAPGAGHGNGPLNHFPPGFPLGS